MKVKNSEKVDKFGAWAQEKLWNMKVTVIPNITVAFGKTLKKEQVTRNPRKNRDCLNYSTAETG